jgi:hypothetical protein
MGWDTAVGIATRYGLDGAGIESRWGRNFPHRPNRPWGPPSLLHNGYRVFLGVESGQGVTLTPHILLVTRPKKQSRAIPLFSLRAFVACKKGETYLHEGLMFCGPCIVVYLYNKDQQPPTSARLDTSSTPILLAASRHKHMTYTNCCIYRIVPPDDEQ